MATSQTNVSEEGNIRRVRSMGDIPQQPNPTASPTRRRDHGSPLPEPFVPLSLSQMEEPPVYHPAQDLNVNFFDKFLAYFGLGRLATQTRKSYVLLLWTILWSLTQIVVIVTIVALSRAFFKDPQSPTVSEWTACDRPLGAWACLWIIRAIASTVLSYWEYLREHAAMENYLSGAPAIIRRANRTNSIPRASEPRRHLPIRQQGFVVPPPNAAYTRLSILSSLLTLSWFLTAHILEYTSVNTCRHTSPHLWWLVFGILSIMYLMVFEVVIIGFLVLVITPIVFVFYNVLLICLGRHPIQNPHVIKPDIEKIPKALVDKIPLVMYIPPPPEGSDLKSTSPKIISNPHTYPPSKKPTMRPKPRFRFLRKKSYTTKEALTNNGKLPVDVEKAPGLGQALSWSDYWEDTEFPFVVLEGNRAACAICLMDFEEPKRKPGLEHPANSSQEKQASSDEPALASAKEDPKEAETAEDLEKLKEAEAIGQSKAGTSQGSSSGITLETRKLGPNKLQLEDAGEEAQPLRLLTCGHVFHKTCLDPWLTDVSGRCPVCQRAVEIPGQRSRKPRERPPREP